MSDEKQPSRGEFDELEPMEELDELEELEELHELDELEELPELEKSGEPLPATSSAAPPSPPAPEPAPEPAPAPAPAPAAAATPLPELVPPPAPPPVLPPSPAPSFEAVVPPTPLPPPSSARTSEPLEGASSHPVPEPLPEPMPSAPSAPSPDAPSTASPDASSSTPPSATPPAAPSGEVPARPPDAAPAEGPAPGQTRELDRAPILLRKAAWILLLASILPWGDASRPDLLPELTTRGLWAGTIAEKLILYLAVWIFFQSHVLKHGGKVLGALAALKPAGMMILAGIVALVGLYWPVTGIFLFTTLGEKILLLLAGFTWIHIYDYERGGKFNPIYPLLFLGAAITGPAAIFEVMNDGPPGLVALLLGTIPVTVSGFIAMYTMVVALKQAKLEGDLKKEAALAARRAARDRKGSGSGPGKTPGTPGAGVVRRRDRT